jgi:transposase
MSRRIALKPHLTTEELFQRYRACRQPNEKTRWRALHLISRGEVAAEAARRVGRTSGWVTQLTRRYNERGAEAVADRRDEAKPGPRPGVSGELALALDAALRSAAPDGGLWTAPKVAAWVAEQTGRAVHATTAWRAMRRLGFTLQVPRPRHRRSASAAEQEAFKKSSATRSPK